MIVKTKAKQIQILRTKKGLPVMWENFTEFETMKKATTIIGSDGKLKRPILQKNNSELVDSLVPVKVGDFIVKAFGDKDGVGVSILVVENIDVYSNEATVRLIVRKNPKTEQIYADDDYIETYTKTLEPEVKNCIGNLIDFTNK